MEENNIMKSKKHNIQEKISIIENKISMLTMKMCILIVKKISKSANEEIKQYVEKKVPKLKCVEISDTHHSNGECKRVIAFATNKNKKEIYASYIYWYTDSTIYLDSSTNNDGINVEECFIKGVEKQDAQSFFEFINDEINWDYFR